MAGTVEPRRTLLSRLFGARRSAGPALRVRRGRFGGVCCLEAEMEVSASGWAGVANALAAAVAEAVAGDATLVRAGIVADDPPVIAAFRPRRDVVAIQVRDALTAGASHRRPHLWLALPPGVWTANALDPDAPFAAAPEAIAAIVAAGSARAALFTEAAPGAGGRVALRLAVYSTPGGVLSSLRAARRALAPPPG